MKHVFTGFCSRVKIDTVNTFCTDFNISINKKIINSNGSFLGGYVSDQGLITNGMPRTDVPEIRISFNFEMTKDLMTKFNDMLKNRRTVIPITIYGHNGTSDIDFKICYWSKISLQVQQNSLLKGSLDVQVYQTYDNVYSYFNMESKDAENEVDGNFGWMAGLIPYYSTKISLSNGNLIPIAWSVDFSQQVVFKTFCNKKPNKVIEVAPLPLRVAFGMMNCNCNVTTLVDSFNLDNIINDITIKDTTFNLNENNIKISTTSTFVTLYDCQLNSANPNYGDKNNYLTCELSYVVNKVKP